MRSTIFSSSSIFSYGSGIEKTGFWGREGEREGMSAYRDMDDWDKNKFGVPFEQ